MSKYNFICRKANIHDDIEKIAKYIYLTDPYIYPKICQNPTDKVWVDFISECTKSKNNIFNINNISVATCDDDIIGITCTVPCGKILTFTETTEIPNTLSDDISLVINGYFKPLINESYSFDGFNIVNVCVDEKYRGKGVGKLLMSHCVREYGSQIIHLDVIVSNTPAVQMYKKFGFEIESEYIGFSGDDTQLPCYHMIRRTDYS